MYHYASLQYIIKQKQCHAEFLKNELPAGNETSRFFLIIRKQMCILLSVRRAANYRIYDLFMQKVKSLEIFFRRLLISVLKLVAKRKKPLPPDIDFNRCKILFVRQDRIGDVLISTPVLTLLKKRYPEAIVDFLLSSKNHFILENDPLVRKRWVYTKSFGNAVGLILAVRREKYDFVVDLMDNPSATSTFICLLAGASRNVGLCKENAYIYDISVPLPSRKNVHIVERTAQVLTVFGIDPGKEKPYLHYTVSEQSEQFALAFLNANKLLPIPSKQENGDGRVFPPRPGTAQSIPRALEKTPGPPSQTLEHLCVKNVHDSAAKTRALLGVNISPAQGNRDWGIKNYRRFIEMTVEAYPALSIVILYQPSDKKAAEEIAQPLGKVVLSPETASFDRFAAIVKHSAFLITPDTSAVHLASAFRIPAVALYVQPDKNVRIWEPYGADSESLISRGSTLDVIDPIEVFRAFGRLYGRNQPPRTEVGT